MSDVQTILLQLGLFAFTSLRLWNLWGDGGSLGEIGRGLKLGWPAVLAGVFSFQVAMWLLVTMVAALLVLTFVDVFVKLRDRRNK